MYSLGTAIGTTQSFSLGGSTLTTYTVGTAYKQKWYQPKYATTYSVSSLRRYNGAPNEGDKVKGYCVGLRDVTSIVTTFPPVPGTTQTVTGAIALTAGAIAFGVAALAM